VAGFNSPKEVCFTDMTHFVVLSREMGVIDTRLQRVNERDSEKLRMGKKKSMCWVRGALLRLEKTRSNLPKVRNGR
jgi:hypothetical protein